MRARKLIALGAATLALSVPTSATAKTAFAGIQAHRGGPNPGAQAVYPEDSLQAFKAAERLRVDVVELDVKLTSDNVPVVLHDATLDRTTNCAGQVRQMTAAALRANCRIDTIGGEDLLRPAAPPGVAVPTLAETLDWADDEGVKLNVEIKNYPTDPDWTPGPGFAQTVLGLVEGSGIPKRDVLIQSFFPQNLDPAKARGFATSFLLLRQGANRAAIETARQGGYDVVSPGWPTAEEDPKTFIRAAHRAGLAVVPFTIDEAAEIRRAFSSGADAVISNDPRLAMRTRYAPLCRVAKARERRLRAKYRKRLRAGRNVRSARRAYLRAKRGRKATCAKIPR